MNEELVKVLKVLLLEFERTADADITCSKLNITDHLTRNECDMVKSCNHTTAKFILIFQFLKAKSDNILRRLQEICIETGWIDLYNLIQSSLKTINYHHLVMTEDEFETRNSQYKRSNLTVVNGKPINTATVNETCINFDVREPDVQFIGREKELSDLHTLMQRSTNASEPDAKKTVISEKRSTVEKSTTVAGLGGIGKTQLALMYVQLYKQEYNNNIVWINAENDVTIKESFRRLAQNMKINEKTLDGMERDVRDIVNQVYTYFATTKCLFIFDNADKPFSNDFYPSSQPNVFLLITSRYQQWGKFKVLQLGTLTLEEAMQLIKKVLKIKDNEMEKVVRKLARKLHFFPLAIKQALAYISETNERKKKYGLSFGITDYLRLFKLKTEELLGYKFFNDFGNEYSQTTFATWAITIDKIKKNEIVGESAINILNKISYFAIEKIDSKMFLEIGKEDELELSIELLQNYSMVDLENGMLRIHPLVQEVTRLNLQRENKEESTFVAVFRLVETFFEKLTLQNDNYGKQNIFLHLETLLGEIKKWFENNPSERKQEEKTYINDILILMLKINPVLFEVKDPDVQFIGREPQIELLHNLIQRNADKTGTKAKKMVLTERCTTIAGLGGIGKTQLALKYIQLYVKEYNSNIMWINAENESTSKCSFQRLAKRLKIKLKTRHSNERNMKDIVCDVFSSFFKVKCLFVFDNADEQLFTEYLYTTVSNETYILITSRYQKWGQWLHLDTFTKEEALLFIRKGLKINDENNAQDADSLACVLHSFPLAIKQAISYINETNEKFQMIGSPFKIADYVKQFNEKAEEFLCYNFSNDLGIEHSQTTFTTWTTTIDKIKENGNKGKLSISILNKMSYLASENIDTQIFSENGNDMEIASVIELLKRFSIIKVENGMLSTHPLMQEMTRLNLKRENIEKATFAEVSQLVLNFFQHLTSLKDHDKKRHLLPHLETLLAKINTWLDNNRTQISQVEQTYVETTWDNWLQQSKIILDQLLFLENQNYEHKPV